MLSNNDRISRLEHRIALILLLMLSESFVASLLTSNATQTTSSALKDAGVCIHEFRPNSSLRATLKKSSTDSNCLAVSASHIFAVQAGKAVVNVYNRERGNQEATLPFPERIRSIAIAGGDDGGGIIILGTEGGKLILWEVSVMMRVYGSMNRVTDVNCVRSALGDKYSLRPLTYNPSRPLSLTRRIILSYQAPRTPRYTFGLYLSSCPSPNHPQTNPRH